MTSGGVTSGGESSGGESSGGENSGGGATETRLGLGCMRLTTPEQAQTVIHAALDAGVRLLDTADAYGPGPGDVGHNEGLVRDALEAWSGDGSEVCIVGKAGLVRRGNRWLPDGRAKHLTAACEASVERLGRPIDLFLLHALDPARKLSTSVRALAKLQARGLVRRVGVCNVRVHELREALDHAEISAVQVGLGPRNDDALRGGVASFCRDRGIQLIAHSPFGGPRRARGLGRNRALEAVAERRGVSSYAVALAWLMDLAENVWPIPGPTRAETVADTLAAIDLALDADDRRALDGAFPAGRLLRTTMAERRPSDDEADGDVVVLMGMPAAGKTSHVRAFVERGYLRLNRDDAGGRLADLGPILDQSLASGCRNIVLDNTYPRRASRNLVVETAWARKAPVRCVWLTTSLEDAQFNACMRMVERHGGLLGPDAMAKANKHDPNSFPPRAQFRYREQLEPPNTDEGFATVEVERFARRPPAGSGRAVFVDPDQLASGPEQPGRPEQPARPGTARPNWGEQLARLAEWRAEGFEILGIGWRPGVDTPPPTVEVGELRVPVRWCTHAAGPPVCWCRKPLPGLAAEHVVARQLDPSASIVWGRGPAERGLAERIGARFEPL